MKNYTIHTLYILVIFGAIFFLVLLWLRMGIIDRKLTCIVNTLPVLESLISPEVAKRTDSTTLNKQIDMIGLTCDNTFIFSGSPKSK